MDYLVPILVTAAITVGMLALIWAGWRSRLRRQAGIGPLAPVPEELGGPLYAAAGQYVVTTSAEDWLDRIAVRQLGIRTNAEVSVHPEGVLFDRAGAPALFIPAHALTGVRLESGMAGKFVEKDGLLVLGWSLGGTAVDTGFRTRAAADKNGLLMAVEKLLPAGTTKDAQ